VTPRLRGGKKASFTENEIRGVRKGMRTIGGLSDLVETRILGQKNAVLTRKQRGANRKEEKRYVSEQLSEIFQGLREGV